MSDHPAHQQVHPTAEEVHPTAVAHEGPSLTIQGIKFPLGHIPRYSEGHTLTAAEASVLNQTRAENLRNNWAGKLKPRVEALVGKDGDLSNLPAEFLAQVQKEFSEYAATYEFGFRTPRETLDPVESLAQKLAKEAITTAIKAKGIDLKTVSKEKLDSLIHAYLEKDSRFRKEAQRRIKVMKDAAGGLDDLLGMAA